MQLTEIQDLVGRSGPFVTVHAEIGRGTEDANAQLEARWTTIRHQLEGESVSDEVIEAVGERLHDNPRVPGEVRRTIVADPGGVVLDDIWVGRATWDESVEVASLPDLSGWLRTRDGQLPFVLVQIDRIGADIATYTAAGQAPTEERSVEGEDYYITKVPQGDWAQKQFQQSAENQWRENAEQVAEEVRSLIRSHRPVAVLVAGDVRAVGDLTELLATPEGPDVVKLDSGGRAEGTDDEALWREVRGILAGIEGHRADLLGQRLAEAQAHQRAAVGVDEVARALAEHRVERLVLDLGTLGDRTARPSQLSFLPLPDQVDQTEEVQLDRLLVAAAALTGAEVELLPAEVQPKGNEGVSALMRWQE